MEQKLPVLVQLNFGISAGPQKGWWISYQPMPNETFPFLISSEQETEIFLGTTIWNKHFEAQKQNSKTQNKSAGVPWQMHSRQCYKFHQICNCALDLQQKVPFPHPCVLSMSTKQERLVRFASKRIYSVKNVKGFKNAYFTNIHYRLYLLLMLSFLMKKEENYINSYTI